MYSLLLFPALHRVSCFSRPRPILYRKRISMFFIDFKEFIFVFAEYSQHVSRYSLFDQAVSKGNLCLQKF